MVTSGSQASGDTGLKICTSGLSAVFTVRDKPHMHAERHRDQGRQQETGEHCLEAGQDLVEIGRRAGIGPNFDLAPSGRLASNSALRLACRVVEGALPGALGEMVGP